MVGLLGYAFRKRIGGQRIWMLWAVLFPVSNAIIGLWVYPHARRSSIRRVSEGPGRSLGTELWHRPRGPSAETRLGRGTPHKSLSGALADIGVDLSAEDIDQARREAWAEFPRRDL